MTSWPMFGAALGSIFVAITTTSVAVYYNRKVHARRRLRFGIALSTPLLSDRGKDASIKVIYSDVDQSATELTDARIVRITMLNDGRKNIVLAGDGKRIELAFDSGKPVAILREENTPAEFRGPKVVVSSSGIAIGPGVLNRNHEWSIDILAEGDVHNVVLVNHPFEDEILKELKEPRPDYGEIAQRTLEKIALKLWTWLFIAFLIFFIAYRPSQFFGFFVSVWKFITFQ